MAAAAVAPVKRLLRKAGTQPLSMIQLEAAAGLLLMRSSPDGGVCGEEVWG